MAHNDHYVVVFFSVAYKMLKSSYLMTSLHFENKNMMYKINKTPSKSTKEFYVKLCYLCLANPLVGITRSGVCLSSGTFWWSHFTAVLTHLVVAHACTIKATTGGMYSLNT